MTVNVLVIVPGVRVEVVVFVVAGEAVVFDDVEVVLVEAVVVAESFVFQCLSL